MSPCRLGLTVLAGLFVSVWVGDARGRVRPKAAGCPIWLANPRRRTTYWKSREFWAALNGLSPASI
jgi:hypothetical protein